MEYKQVHAKLVVIRRLRRQAEAAFSVACDGDDASKITKVANTVVALNQWEARTVRHLDDMTRNGLWDGEISDDDD